MLSVQEQVELFHLIFLKHLGERIDKSFYSLKGGCNLRFFFKSIRYSEDIDFDVRTIAVDTLKNQVTKLLSSKPFQDVLKTKELRISEVNSVKQTETTQRWKIKVEGPASSMAIPTKIEFSRRGMKEGILHEAVDFELTSKYHIYQILTSHYDKSQALTQKIDALIHRAETQARDVFDLDLLLGQGASVSKRAKDEVDKAIESVMSIGFGDFKSQVVSYLAPEYQEHYGTAKAWDAMQSRVVSTLERLRA